LVRVPRTTGITRLPAAALAFVVCVKLFCHVEIASAQTAEDVIDTLLIRSITQFLSHDSLRGRATGSRGAGIAATHIASTCATLGLAPVNDRFLHPVPVARAVFDPRQTRVTLSNNEEERTFEVARDFLPTGALRSTLTGFAGPAVFVGEQDDILSGLAGDLTGKVAVTSAPLLRAAAGDTLRRRGVAGVVHLIQDEATRQSVEWLRGTRPLYLQNATESSFFPSLPTVAAWPELSEALRDLSRLTSPGDLPWDLSLGVTVETNFTSQGVTSHNVACLVAGSDPEAQDTAIVLTAHFDHLGVGRPNETGDSIFNGFSDNAAGVAMLLATAKAVASREERLRHSVLFLFVTGEEKGLLGSDHFVADPLWPLEEILGVINLDAGAPPAPPNTWEIAGGEGTAFGSLAAEVASSREWTTRNSQARPNSDYYPFWRRGVPAIFIIPGPGPYDGLSIEDSEALRTRWDRYHRAGDEWSASFPFQGVARYAAFAYLITEALDGRGLPAFDGR
jgi:hypothetical protein